MARLEWYAEGLDPARVPTCPPPSAITKLPDDDPVVLAQQAALYQAVPKKYLKVVMERMQEMTQAEKDTVDAPAQARAAATAVATQEMKTNEVCANHTLQQITAYWKGPGGKQEQLQAFIATLDTAIATVPAGNPKDALIAARNGLVAVMTLVVDDGERSWRFVCSHLFVSPYAKGP